MAMTPTSSPRSRWFALAILCIGAFTTALNTTMLSPLVIPISDYFAIPVAAAGQLSTTTAAFAAVTALVMVPWLDRHTRRFWLRLEGLILLLAIVATAFAPSVPWLFAARALAGVGGAFIFAVCLAAASDIFSDRLQRNRALSFVGTAATLGALMGLPVLTKVEELAGWRAAVGVTVLLAITLLGGTFLLEGTHQAGSFPTRRRWLAGYQRVLSGRDSASVQLANIGLSAVWFGFLIYLGAYARTEFGYSANALALLYIAGGSGEVAGNLAAPLLLRHVPARPVGAALGVILGCSLLLIGRVALQGWGLVPLVATVSLAGASLFTVLTILLIDALPDARGAGTALLSAGFEIGGVTGVALAGLLLTISGAYATAYGALGIVALTVAALIVAGRAQAISLETQPVA
jgi:predicted MFS family arabinose efflux permease